jgi:hypothetical protein
LKKPAILIIVVLLSVLLSACDIIRELRHPQGEATIEATPMGTETTVHGIVVENIQGIAFDGNNEIILETEAGPITVLVMESGFVTEDMRDKVCNKNQIANEVAMTLQAGDEIEVFGLLRTDGVLAVCGDTRFTITVLNTQAANPEATPTGTETTVQGTVVENIQGIAYDGNNEIILETEAGPITVLVMESGFVTEDMRDKVCNKNPIANEVAMTLQPGHEIEVFGLLRTDGVLAVCSDPRFTITLLN